MTAHLIRGDARMLPLADKSVQVVVTSPPYFGLRQYSTNPVIWGGDPDCPHTLEDGPAVKPMTGGTGSASKKQVTNAGSQFGNAWAEVHPPGYRSSDTNPGPLQGPGNTNRERIGSAICTRCGAWSGELGSEPTPALFVAHMVEVFQEVKRVLRDDGVCFLNIGDSYAGSGGYAPDAPSNTRAEQITRGARAGGGYFGSQVNGARIKGRASPNGTRPKSLLLVPERLAIALADDGWIVRQVLIWAKNNPMPESVKDRWTTAHEYVLMLVKQPRYYFDQQAIRESYAPASIDRFAYAVQDHRSGIVNGTAARDAGAKSVKGAEAILRDDLQANPAGRNGRSVWNLNGERYPGAHFATFPREIPRRCILAASREGDIVLDPFSGSGTTAYVAASLGRVGVGVELSPTYCQQARLGRLAQEFLPI